MKFARQAAAFAEFFTSKGYTITQADINAWLEHPEDVQAVNVMALEILGRNQFVSFKGAMLRNGHTVSLLQKLEDTIEAADEDC